MRVRHTVSLELALDILIRRPLGAVARTSRFLELVDGEWISRFAAIDRRLFILLDLPQLRFEVHQFRLFVEQVLDVEDVETADDGGFAVFRHHAREHVIVRHGGGRWWRRRIMTERRPIGLSSYFSFSLLFFLMSQRVGSGDWGSISLACIVKSVGTWGNCSNWTPHMKEGCSSLSS